MERSPRPIRPKRIISGNGKWEIIPDVEIYSVKTLDPETQEQRERAEKLGPLIRILYCAKTYDMACEKVDRLVEQGVHPERIECVFARRDTVQAIFNQRFEVVPMTVMGEEA